MEVAIIISALSLGFASGFHCIGMCGPIALSLGLSKEESIRFYLKNLTYQFGRIFTYSLLGVGVGIVGEGFQLGGFQNYLTIFAGVLLIVLAVFSFGGKDFVAKLPLVTRSLTFVKTNLAKLLKKTDYKSRFLTGVLNGFLPCGMVYMALTASLAAGGILESSAFMFLFGIGTLPLMFIVVLLGNMISQSFRTTVLKVIPVMMILLGGLFILRGLELGIPYLSPPATALQVHQMPDGSSHQAAENCH